MIPVSTDVRQMINSGAKQRALLHFVEQGVYFTAKDIVLKSFKYTGSFNPDTELTMGKAVSASLNYSLFNDDGALNTFTFGEFNAYMGVKMAQFPYAMDGYTNAVVDFNSNRYQGRSAAPYLMQNGSAFSTQPDSPVEALVVLDDTLYCLSSNRTVLAIRQTDSTRWEDLETQTWLSQEVYTWDSYAGEYSVWTTTITDELTWALAQRYIARHTGLSLINNEEALIFEDGIAESYRYTQIGHFYADKPARVRVNVVAVTSYDAMQAKLNEPATGLTTPTTVQGLYDQLVTETGVTNKAEALLNGSMPVPSIDFSDMTFREVLSLIAQAACCYALFDYDGKLDMRWFTTTDISLDEHNYKECVPYEFTVKEISKFQARTSESDVGIIVGTGTNTYYLQNHPFFVFDSDAAGRPYCEAIYNRLITMPEHTPGHLNWFVDFTVQAGDIITLRYRNDVYRFPIFNQSYVWSGICIGDSDSTGAENRGLMSTYNRKEWREQKAQGKRYTEITANIDGIRVKTGIDNLSTGETLYSKITATESAITSEVSRATAAEGQLSSAITQQADSVTATFRKIGASGYTATGVTTISESGIRVTHSSLSNCYTEMTASGFFIKNASNKVLGGLYTPRGQSSVQACFSALSNPDYPDFTVQITRMFSGESADYFYGLGLYYRNTLKAILGGALEDGSGKAFMLDGNGGTASIESIIYAAKQF